MFNSLFLTISKPGEKAMPALTTWYYLKFTIRQAKVTVTVVGKCLIYIYIYVCMFVVTAWLLATTYGDTPGSICKSNHNL